MLQPFIKQIKTGIAILNTLLGLNIVIHRAITCKFGCTHLPVKLNQQQRTNGKTWHDQFRATSSLPPASATKLPPSCRRTTPYGQLTTRITHHGRPERNPGRWASKQVGREQSSSGGRWLPNFTVATATELWAKEARDDGGGSGGQGG